MATSLQRVNSGCVVHASKVLLTRQLKISTSFRVSSADTALFRGCPSFVGHREVKSFSIRMKGFKQRRSDKTSAAVGGSSWRFKHTSSCGLTSEKETERKNTPNIP